MSVLVANEKECKHGVLPILTERRLRMIMYLNIYSMSLLWSRFWEENNITWDFGCGAAMTPISLFPWTDKSQHWGRRGQEGNGLGWREGPAWCWVCKAWDASRTAVPATKPKASLWSTRAGPMNPEYYMSRKRLCRQVNLYIQSDTKQHGSSESY